MTVSDHFPMSCCVDIEISSNSNVSNVANEIYETIPWDTLTDEQVNEYAENQRNITEYLLYDDIFECTEVCNRPDHIDRIKIICDELIGIMQQSSQCLLISKSKRFQAVPDWNSFVRDARKNARTWFKIWVREGYEYDCMRQTRNIFREKLKECRNSETRNRNDKLYESFKDKDKKQFWRDIRRIKGSKKVLPSVIDNKNTDADITNLFQGKFSKLLDNNRCQNHNQNFHENLDNITTNRSVHCITFQEVERAILRLKNMNDPDKLTQISYMPIISNLPHMNLDILFFLFLTVS